MMKKALTILAAAGMTVAMVGGTSAADIPMAPAAPPAAPAPVAPPAPAFSWGGAYIGPTAAFNFMGPGYKTLGVVAGYDVQFNRIVAGARVFTTSPSPYGAPFFVGAISGSIGMRAGVLFGDRVLAYGLADLGFTAGPDVAWYDFGIGAEFAVNDTFHVFAEVTQSNFLGGPPIARAIRLGVTMR